jgi:hypothetical protein
MAVGNFRTKKNKQSKCNKENINELNAPTQHYYLNIFRDFCQLNGVFTATIG